MLLIFAHNSGGVLTLAGGDGGVDPTGKKHRGFLINVGKMLK